MSISVMSSYEDEPIFILVKTTIENALEEMINKMEHLRKKYINCLYRRYCTYFREIAALEDAKARKTLTGALLDWVESMPVYGFNYAAYDLMWLNSTFPDY